MSSSKKANIADKATLHFYFVTEVLKEAEGLDIDPCELFCVGEDILVSELYQYTHLIATVENEHLLQNDELLLSDRQDYLPSLANCFWGIVTLEDDSDEMPELEHFELDVRRTIGTTIRDRLDSAIEFVVMGRLHDEDDTVMKVYAESKDQAENKFENWLKASPTYKDRVKNQDAPLDIYIEFCRPYSTMERTAIK